MNDTKVRHFVEPSPAVIARAREIYCGASKMCTDPQCEKK